MSYEIHETAVTDRSDHVTATCVPVARRMQFLPRYFGRDMILGEALVYRWLDELAPDYNGGFWAFYELSNGGFYMAPKLDCETLHICCAGNYYDGRMSPDAAGVVATLFALNHMVWTTHKWQLQELYDRLRDYAGNHDESRAILAAID